jgi:biopolymer transport protein ExbB/TolQ
MIDRILTNCGPLAWPQLAISLLTVSVLVGYAVALIRGEIARGAQPWRRTLEPLAGIATTLGLLGSVLGFILAFDSLGGSLDVERLARGLSSAYWTTGVGIVTALIATAGNYLLGVVHPGEVRL